ncbi:hypothetical protein DKX38_010252 [Salix brachista]|uniref:Late embryogenesis abundant protein LEA-2 subgroup domain-containing protein n=1 Tax=Salix brachista TaxID=2182728 RepID=A0A5N5MFF3_9ROSI|nr:hypothetical protein DKX38_010252 [Salix brachista]
MWLVLSPQLPVFHVDNFSVSNFNATLPTFTANWEANLTVRNPNTKLTIEFGELQNFVFYEEDYLLASATAPRPFSLETRTSGVINAKLSANNKDNLVENWVLDKLAKERSNGSVSFNFRMLFWTTFRSGLWWKRHLSMKVLCEDIQVSFVGASGYGNIAANGGRDCLVFV